MSVSFLGPRTILDFFGGIDERGEMQQDALKVAQVYILSDRYLSHETGTTERTWGETLFSIACALLETVRDPIDYLALYSRSLRMVEKHLLPEP